MSDYERWVRPAVQAVLAANYGPGDGTTEALIAGDMRIALATVGPLIAEDTRERMVAAAAVAVEREGGVEWKAAVVPCAVCAAAVIPIETAREYFFNGDEADDAWVDKP